MARIAIGGFQHETNTFAPIKADWACFQRVDSFPGYMQGEAMRDGLQGRPVPAAGALAALEAAGHTPVWLCWGGATPSAPVTRDAFERIAEDMVAALRAAGPVDGVYLDLHGAAVAEHLEDAEGAMLARVRDAVGPHVPIAASLDLHANVTRRMAETAEVLESYRTYPHVDMAETGARALRHLCALIERPAPWHRAYRQADFLVPITWMCTLMEPAAGLYRLVQELAQEGALVPQLCLGFPLADIADCGPALSVAGRDPAAVEAAADRLFAALQAAEPHFAGRLYTPEEAVATAKARAREAGRPIILADTQDNPGGGGPGDTTGLLRALVDGGAEGAVLGVLIDAESAAAAHAAGEGATLRLALGAKSGMPGHTPFVADCVVERLGDGRFTGTGPMFGGTRFQMGPMALVRVGPVRCLIASVPAQAGDQAQFRALGIEPAEQPILALKSSVHFRADFQPIAEEILVVAAPGPVTADHATLSYRALRPGVRVMPRAGAPTEAAPA